MESDRTHCRITVKELLEEREWKQVVGSKYVPILNLISECLL